MAWLLAIGGCFLLGPGDEADGTDATVPQAPPDAWQEPDWCADMADLADIEAAHGGDALRASLVAISEARYPPAVAFIEGQDDGQLATWFFGDPADWDVLLDGYEVATHEGCHIWGFDHFSFDTYTYRVVDDDLIFETSYLDNFDRSEILTRHPDPASDFYASTYLEGDSGAQGFNTLLDEFNAYTHSLVARYCTRDALGGSSISARDGILTMMWYVELYLAIAREEHPDDYAAITGDAPTVEMILATWARAEHWLAITADYPELGLDDEAISELTYDPANVAEIDRLREL